MVVYAFSPHTREAEAGVILSSTSENNKAQDTYKPA